MLHTWGSALTHHPHVHGIVPGGGLSPDGERWIACRPGFFLPVRVLSRLFRRRFLEALQSAHHRGHLQFFGEYAGLADPATFARWLAPLRACEWVVYAKRPFAGPKAVLAYLSRYTHRVAISNQRLVAFDERGVTFRWKDYRAKGRTRYKTMTLEAGEFMRRFLLHVLPGGFHRIRHYGLLANPVRRANLAKVRDCCTSPPESATSPDERHHRNPPRLYLPALRRTDDRHRDPPAHRPDSRTADAPGSDMNSTVPRPACQTLAPRQRGPRADICACRFAKRYDRPLHHRKCTTTPLRYGVSAPPAARLAVPHPTPLTIRAYQSP